MGQTNQAIEAVTKKIVHNFQPEQIVLFGSHAWGTPDANSDIDIMIVKSSNKTKIDRMREIRSDLFGLQFPPLDLLVYTPEEVTRDLAAGDSFLQEVLHKGKVLYERLPSLDI